MKRAVVFLNGYKPSQKLIDSHIKKTDTIICADGGAEHALARGITPHVIIGDQDSLSQVTLKKLQKKDIIFQKYPREKNETDSELALSYVREKGFKELVVIGMNGDRFDHVISNLFMFSNIPKYIHVSILEESQTFYIVHDTITIKGKRGEYLSLIPLNSDVTGITTKNLAYPLSHASLLFGKTRGISNEFVSTTAHITIHKGILLIIHTLQRK